MLFAALLACVSARALHTRIAENAQWFFDTQLDHDRSGAVDVGELLKTLGVVHPDALETLAKFGGAVDGSDGLAPLRRFVASRDVDGDSRVSRREFVSGVDERFAWRTQQVAFGVGDDDATELQIHLAWGADPTSTMSVTFVNFAKAPQPTIRYRVPGSRLYTFVACNTTTYDAGIWGWNGFIYNGMLSGLASETTYSYAVSIDNATFTGEQNFTTARAHVKPSEITRYAWYGDQGSFFPEGFVVAAAVCAAVSDPSNQYAAVIHAGDLAYATSIVGDQKEISSLWDVWTELIACAASRVAYMTADGNHEDPYDFASFGHRFYMPYVQKQFPPTLFWYSVDHEHVHWVFIDTQQTLSAAQLQWLDADLAAADANRATRPWIVMVGHRPMLCSDKGEFDAHNPKAQFFQTYATLLDKYNVDLYLSGHMHMQESLNPIFRNGTVEQRRQNGVYVRPQNTVMVVQGTAGIFMFTEQFVEPQPDWSAYRGAEYFGFGRMTFNLTHAHYEYVATFEFESEKVVDEFYISKI